jgi:hypothetical protein
MNPDNTQIAELINTADPRCVMDEVKTVVGMIFTEFDFTQVDRAFGDVIRLFSGGYPGYQGCNTRYHDLKHTTDTLLALIRLIHGAVITGLEFTERNVKLGLICALLHDTGYIQKTNDMSGTGAKYTIVHIARSVEFMEKYFAENGFSPEDFSDGRDILYCTGLYKTIPHREFRAHQIELIGKMLGSADLLGQMSDRMYLEKLSSLFDEFIEGNVGDYQSELDLLEKTIAFYDVTQKRLRKELAGVNRFMRYHFMERWKIERDLYAEAINNNIEYLKMVLKDPKEDHHLYFRRTENQKGNADKGRKKPK